MQRFTLQGSIYYQQFRKCGKGTCTTCANPRSNGHGPYWYRRDRRTGKIHYIGRHLPPQITATQAARSTLRVDATAIQLTLRRQQEALHAFIVADHLSDAHITILKELGLEQGIL